MTEPRRWALDSSILLGALANGKAECGRLLRHIDDTGVTVVASTLLIAECVRVPSATAQAALDQLLQSSTIQWVELTRSTAILARDLASKYNGLRGADAAHLASAVVVQADAFFGDDRAFPYGETVDTVLVCRPGEIPGQQSLG